ncbi:DUF397 domain-containing protein [Streptomyces profundus]|uniref:DUF397 domain-containing protein n=1 Tax=Streptomyces profundus TaxID=2867410 RepID=UPI001D16C82A|nr:DUF397 domain-containing protein [Streptomyces sp. MA3_2.13]UED85857.1 DUF397 domain-containing protein [Streptomyces sp. MA3_2.13]
MAQPNTSGSETGEVALVWRKSSHSNHNGDCVELATLRAAVLLRDSKDREGPVIRWGKGSMRVFVGRLRGGDGFLAG